MSRQQIRQQLAFIRDELTRISHELACAEEAHAQYLRIRQNRLSSELHRLESVLRDGIAATAPPQR